MHRNCGQGRQRGGCDGDADREGREDTGEIRIVTCNANRLIDDDLMRDAVDEMRQRRVHIVIWTETHFQQKHSLIFEKIADKNIKHTR